MYYSQCNFLNLHSFENNFMEMFVDNQSVASENTAFVDFQSDLGKKSSMIMFLTAVFERSAMKYMARSYRFILIETGHVAQNINLVTTALGRSILNVGGFFFVNKNLKFNQKLKQTFL